MFKSIDAQNAACNAVTRLIDLGSTYPSGLLNLYGADTTSLVLQLPLGLPAFKDATDGTAVSNYIPDVVSTIDATACFFGVLNRDASTVFTGTVSDMTGSGDLKLNSVVIPVDSTVLITNLIYIVPPEFTYIGQQGVTGLAGIDGQTGVAGLPGVTGYAGSPGSTGIGGLGSTGVQGIQGRTGISGFGTTGIQGAQGPAGSQGVTGFRGTTGIQGLGIQGSTGVQGNPGSQGAPGSQGSTGVSGYGTTGVQGSQGQTGVQGLRGVTGLVGITGLVGTVGSTGIQGQEGGNAGRIYYLEPQIASDIPTYFQANEYPSPLTEATIVKSSSGTTDVLVGAFATDSTGIGVDSIPAGTAFRHIHGNVADGTSAARYRLDAYQRDGVTEVLLRTSYSQNFTGTIPSEVIWNVTDGSAYDVDYTTRVVFKLYASRVSGTNPLNITTYFDGTARTSFVQTTISAGAVGPQGHTGLRGLTGLQGPQGNTGIQGQTGFGVQGSTGLGGPLGATGVQGSAGPQGITGLRGLTGFIGSTGLAGSGLTGLVGATGVQGLGLTGLRGFTGLIGSTGVQGNIGIQGTTGSAGLQGSSGQTGVQGPLGIQGITGLRGVTGLGFTGMIGSTGVQGNPGSQGATGFGVAGSPGSIGATGVQGTAGSAGPQGITGLRGITGFIGSTGIQGTAGSAGPQGITGLRGVTGFIGSTGIQGATGFGLQGVTGLQGLQGNQGNQGNVGNTGATGIQGVQGVTGLRGLTGIAGLGSTGLMGATGVGGGASGALTHYSEVFTYQVVNNGTQEGWIKSSGTLITGLSWTRSGSTVTITHSGHGLSNGDYVLCRNLNNPSTDYIYSAVSNVSASTFDVTVASSGDGSGSDGAYSGAFGLSSVSASGCTIVPPTSTSKVADVQIISLVYVSGTRGASGAAVVFTLPTTIKNGGASNNTISSIMFSGYSVSSTSGTNLMASTSATFTASTVSINAVSGTQSAIYRLSF